MMNRQTSLELGLFTRRQTTLSEYVCVPGTPLGVPEYVCVCDEQTEKSLTWDGSPGNGLCVCE